MLARVSSTELTEWQAYEQVSGQLGQERDDVLAALVSLVVANSAGSKKKLKLADFLPKWDRPRQTASQQADKIRALHVMFGGDPSQLPGGG